MKEREREGNRRRNREKNGKRGEERRLGRKG